MSKRFSGSITLPHIARPKQTVAIICDLEMEGVAKELQSVLDQQHTEDRLAACREGTEKESLGHLQQGAAVNQGVLKEEERSITPVEQLHVVTLDDLKRLNKNKKLVKKFFAPYKSTLAADTIIRTIPRIVGPQLNRARKFPQSVTIEDAKQSNTMGLLDQINKARSTVKFQQKKVSCLGCALGHVQMSEEHLRQNIVMAVNFLVSLLRRNWHNVESLYIKSSMGPSHKIYGGRS